VLSGAFRSTALAARFVRAHTAVAADRGVAGECTPRRKARR
jgi:hypothetical protein